MCHLQTFSMLVQVRCIFACNPVGWCNKVQSCWVAQRSATTKGGSTIFLLRKCRQLQSQIAVSFGKHGQKQSQEQSVYMGKKQTIFTRWNVNNCSVCNLVDPPAPQVKSTNSGFWDPISTRRYRAEWGEFSRTTRMMHGYLVREVLPFWVQSLLCVCVCVCVCALANIGESMWMQLHQHFTFQNKTVKSKCTDPFRCVEDSTQTRRKVHPSGKY